MPRHYRKLRGNSAYYPFAARTGMRARQRREVRALRIAGYGAAGGGGCFASAPDCRPRAASRKLRCSLSPPLR